MLSNIWIRCLAIMNGSILFNSVIRAASQECIENKSKHLSGKVLKESRDTKQLSPHHIIVLNYTNEKDKALLPNNRMVVAIRKGALGYIDAQVEFWLNSKIQEQTKNNQQIYDTDTSNNYVVELDWNKLASLEFESISNELRILLTLFFNENNYMNKTIIERPYSSKSALKYKQLQTIIEACTVLLPDLNSWCRFFTQTSTYFSNLSIINLKQTVQCLMKNAIFNDAINKAKNNVDNLDEDLFFNMFILFSQMLTKLSKNKYETELEMLKPFKVNLLEVLVKLCQKLVTQIKSEKEIQQQDTELEKTHASKLFTSLKANLLKSTKTKTKEKQLKTRLLKSFIKLFLGFKRNTIEQQNDEINDLQCQAYLGIIYLFLPSEFYDLYLDEFVFLPDYFEFYLRSVLKIRSISTSEGVVGKISATEPESISRVLEQSESFLVRYFKEDRKVWIHFGLNTIQKLRENVDKAFLHVFWRALRNYAVLLGGDGILMTFEDKNEVADNPASRNPDSLCIRIKKCGFWNLVDPCVEGKVVFTKGQRMIINKVLQIVELNVRKYQIFLEIDGKSNFVCPCTQQRSEIVIFYEDTKSKEKESNLFTYLPGCMVSESFDIMNSSGTEFDLRKIKEIEQRMLALDPVKVSVLFGGNPRLNMSQLEKSQTLCECFRERNPFSRTETILFVHKNLEEAFSKICFVLKRLSRRKQSFRELSLDFFHGNLLTDFKELVKVLRLTTLKYNYLGFIEEPTFNNSILCAMSRNRFIKHNLQYLETVPLLEVPDLEAGSIFETAPLKKIVLFQCAKDIDYNLYFESLFKMWIKTRVLQEMELYFHIYRYAKLSKKFIYYLKQMKLSRLSLHFSVSDSVGCKRHVIDGIFTNFLGGPSVLLQSLKFFHYFFRRSNYSDDEPTYSLSADYPDFLQTHLIPLTYLFFEPFLRAMNKTKLLGFRPKGLIPIQESRNSLISRLLSVN